MHGAGVVHQADTRMLAIYHDDPDTTPADELRAERVANSPSYEIYANTPMDTPKDELRTDIYVPLV